VTGGKHRLSNIRNGVRWSEPASGVVFITCMGDVMHVDRGLIGSTNRQVDTGDVWRPQLTHLREES